MVHNNVYNTWYDYVRTCRRTSSLLRLLLMSADVVVLCGKTDRTGVRALTEWADPSAGPRVSVGTRYARREEWIENTMTFPTNGRNQNRPLRPIQTRGDDDRSRRTCGRQRDTIIRNPTYDVQLPGIVSSCIKKRINKPAIMH
jgi:hypothetical protein